jgi:hypothetical protein
MVLFLWILNIHNACTQAKLFLLINLDVSICIPLNVLKVILSGGVLVQKG